MKNCAIPRKPLSVTVKKKALNVTQSFVEEIIYT